MALPAQLVFLYFPDIVQYWKLLATDIGTYDMTMVDKSGQLAEQDHHHSEGGVRQAVPLPERTTHEGGIGRRYI